MGFSLTQLQDPASSTFTYFLADILTKEAVIIDPVLEQVNVIDLAADVTLPTQRLSLSMLLCTCRQSEMLPLCKLLVCS